MSQFATLRDFFAISPLDYRIDLIAKAALWAFSVYTTINSVSAAKRTFSLGKVDVGTMIFALTTPMVFGLLSLFAGCELISSLSEAMRK